MAIEGSLVAVLVAELAGAGRRVEVMAPEEARSRLAALPNDLRDLYVEPAAG